jgi:hypothetical protein
MGYVQVQSSVRYSDSWCLKLMREISVSSFRDFGSSFQSMAAENWKERQPMEEFTWICSLTCTYSIIEV